MRVTQIFLVALLCLTTSCVTSVRSDLAKYQKQFIAKSSFMPSKEELDGKMMKVAVFPLEENGNQVATQAQLGSSMADNIENVLGTSRIAQIVDRKGAEKLQKEVALAEMKKTGAYKGPQVADYAVSGTIANASFNGEYTPGSVGLNPVTGQISSIPPKFNFTSAVSGNVKIYELPSLAVIQTIEFSAKKKVTENTQEQGGLNIMGLVKIGAKEVKVRDRDDGMVRRAGLEAVNDIQVDIKNALAKRGYIIEKRSLKNDSIFKINLGASDGIKAGDEFEVVGKYEVENQITGETEIETRIIATGEITDGIEPGTAWIVVDDKDLENQVRLGDVVKMKYKKGLFDFVHKWM